MADKPDDPRLLSRRKYLLSSLIGSASFVGLAGCTGGGGGDGGDGGDGGGGSGSGSGGGSGSGSGGGSGGGGGSTQTQTSGGGGGGGGGSNEFEVLHRWTRGNDGNAMSTLLQGFGKKHPEVRILENTLPGQAGANMKTVIRDRMLNNNPPSTWQTWPGKNLTEFTDADLLGDIEEDVWNSNNMKDAYMEGPMRAAKPAGNFVTVPLNIHRMNPLFYNVSVIEEAGVDADSLDSLDALMAAFDKIDSDTDATAFAQSTSEAWTTLQLWETIFLATGGHDQYQTFTGGSPGDTESATKEALQTVIDMRDYFPGDATSMTWPDAAQNVVNGDAGFLHQGDWAAGVFLELDDMQYGEDWDWIPFPGTGSMYSIVMDGFPYPAPNRSPEATKKFLRYCGTAEAQELFNPVKGSIPPRTDVSTEPFSEYQKDQIENFRNSESQPNTIAHGLAVTPAERTDLLSVTSRFTSNWNVDSAFDGFVQVFQ